MFRLDIYNIDLGLVGVYNLTQFCNQMYCIGCRERQTEFTSKNNKFSAFGSSQAIFFYLSTIQQCQFQGDFQFFDVDRTCCCWIGNMFYGR